MSQPLKLMRESFSLLWGRLSVLLFPVVVFLLVVDVIRSRVMFVSAVDWRWFLVLGILLLLKAAFAAGWFNMVYEVTAQSRSQRKQGEGDSFQRITDTSSSSSAFPDAMNDSFGLLKSFFPGVGDYFLPMALGILLTTGVVFLIFWLIQQDVQNTIGYPHAIFERLSELLAEGPEGQEEMQTYINTMSLTDQERLSLFLEKQLLGVFGSLVFVFLTMFWIPILMIRRVNVFSAYGQSLRFFFRDPIRLALLGLAYGGSFFSLMFLALLNPLLGIVCLFLMIFMGITIGIFLFLYVFDVDDKERGGIALHKDSSGEEERH